MKSRKTIARLLVGFVLCLVISNSAVGQTESVGNVSYKPPRGWTRTAKDTVVAFSKHDQITGAYCIITLYGAKTGTGSAQTDFVSEWNNLVVKPFGVETDPKTETTSEAGWTGISGGSGIEFQGAKAAAFLTVLSRGRTVISVLGVTNTESYLSELIAFVSSIEVVDSNVGQDERATLSPLTTMHVAELVREFETNEVRANQNFVGRRVRVNGTVNTVEFDREGNIVLTFKSSITTYRMAHCYFRSSESSKVSSINAGQQVTVDATVSGLGDGFAGSKAFLVLKNCSVQ